VLATWKVLVAVVGMPTLYGLYSLALFSYLHYYNHQHSLLISLGVWILLPLIQYMSVLLLENSIDIYRLENSMHHSGFNPPFNLGHSSRSICL
jgi:glycerol-3-phosphate O-acyltransferase/dihydroxyacetone phosphate acyltransferase